MEPTQDLAPAMSQLTFLPSPQLSKKRRNSLKVVSKQMHHEHRKQDKKVSNKSKSEGIKPLKKHDKEKIMKYLWKDVRNRNVKTLENMLNTGVFELRDVDPSGTLLSYASQYQYKDILTILLKYGTPIVCNRCTGLSPLHTSVKLGDDPTTAILISHGAPLETPSLFEQKTALHFAVRQKKTTIIKMLLDQGCCVNSQDIYGSSAIHHAAQSGEARIINLLLDYRADIELRDNEGWTTLHLAADGGHQDLLKLLLKKGVDINAQTRYGKTALHLSCHRGHLAVVQALLDSNITADVKDNHGKTPVDYCRDPNITSLVLSCIKLTDVDMEEENKHIDMNINSKSLIDLLDPEYLDQNYYSSENTETEPRLVNRDIPVDLESLDQGMYFAQSEPSLSESGTSRDLFFLSHLKANSKSTDNIVQKHTKPSIMADLETIVEVNADDKSSSRKASRESTQILFTSSNSMLPSILATDVMTETVDKDNHPVASETNTPRSKTSLISFSQKEHFTNSLSSDKNEVTKSRKISHPLPKEREKIPDLGPPHISRCHSMGEVEEMQRKTCNHLDKCITSIADVTHTLDEIENSSTDARRSQKCEELKELMKQWTVEMSVFKGNMLSRSLSSAD